MTDRSPVSESELVILKALWKLGPATVRELDAALRKDGRDWAYNTVQTLLQRLRAKGYVRSDARSLAHVFTPSVTREQLIRRRLNDLAADFCEGTATPLVRALVEGHRFSPKDLDELRELIRDADRKRAGSQERRGKGKDG